MDYGKELGDHYDANLERYIRENPGLVLVLKLDGKMSERFYTKREFQEMLRDKRAEARNKRLCDIVIGGGAIGNSAVYEIPRKMPEKIPFELVTELMKRV